MYIYNRICIYIILYIIYIWYYIYKWKSRWKKSRCSPEECWWKNTYIVRIHVIYWTSPFWSSLSAHRENLPQQHQHSYSRNKWTAGVQTRKIKTLMENKHPQLRLELILSGISVLSPMSSSSWGWFQWYVIVDGLWFWTYHKQLQPLELNLCSNCRVRVHV